MLHYSLTRTRVAQTRMAAVDMPEATATSAGWRDADQSNGWVRASGGAASPTSLGRLLRLATLDQAPQPTPF